MKPPKDIKQWWLAPCCGPLSLDIDEECGFCGESHRKCAEEYSEFVKQQPTIYIGDPDRNTPRDCCGGSGFWCSACGRFWAQDTCGNYELGDNRSADGVRQTIREDVDSPEGCKVSCSCGHFLGTVINPT